MFRKQQQLVRRGVLASAALAAILAQGCAHRPQPKTANHQKPSSVREGQIVGEGLASWYGPGFYGRKTASGERFERKSLTCAHRNLPFGSKIKVTNLENDRSVVVTVNDRGPFVHARIVDLSWQAAEAIDLIRTGTAPVRVEVVHTDEL